jgi:GNAT superfamily N-acetyltransferase
MSDLSLRPVLSKADRNQFIEVQSLVQQGLPNAVTPLAIDMHAVIDPRQSAFLRENPSAAWIALRGDRPVGRIMAIHDKAHLTRHNDNAGHFGFIEFENDPTIAQALLNQAEAWLRAAGLTTMTGPFSPSVNHETGLLVAGFETPPAYLMNYAPVYYGEVLEAAGLRKLMDLHSFTCSTDLETHPASTRAMFERLRQTKGLRIRNLDVRHYRRDISMMVDIYNDGWSNNWGAVPMSDAEAQDLGTMLRPLIGPEWLMFAEQDGEPIGVALQMPDLNEAIRDFGGRLLPFNWAKLLYRVRKPTVRNSRMLMLGIRKDRQGRSIGPIAAMLLIDAALGAAKKHGIRTAELGWVLETNAAILSVINKFSITGRKTYRVYEKSI